LPSSAPKERKRVVTAPIELKKAFRITDRYAGVDRARRPRQQRPAERGALGEIIRVIGAFDLLNTFARGDSCGLDAVRSTVMSVRSMYV
jgi:hypothetical protein